LVLHALRRAGYDPTAERVETESDFRARLTPVPEVILADFSLPDFDALRALAIVQAGGLDIPFIVVSGTIGEERAVEVMRAGASDYIIKDRLGRLGQAVAHALDKKARRDEARLAERRLGAQHATTKVLSEALDLDAAVPRIFEAVCTSMGWSWAAAWMADPQAGHLRLGQFWHAPSADADGFLTACREKKFAPGEGLPGRVWATGEPLWVADVMRDEGFFGKPAAAAAGLHAAIAFPVLLGREVVGVIEFLSQRIERPDEKILGMMAAVGSQVGQFIERKRVEEGFRLFRALIDQTTDGIEVIDPATGRYLDANETACAAHGFTKDEYLGLRVQDIDPLVTSRPWVELTAHRRLAGTRTFQSRHLRKDGSSFPVEVNLTFVRMDRDYLVSVARDITERERADRAVRVSEERYRTLVAATSAIVWDSPPSGEFDSDQPGWTAFTGQTLAEHRGWGWLDAVHPDDREASARAWAAATAERREYRVEHRLRRADGEYRQMSGRAFPILDPDGAIREWVGTHTDVTDQRQAERALRDREELLQTIIAHIPCGVFWKDRNSVLLGCNNQFAEDFGAASPEALIGESDDTLATAADAAAFIASDRRVIETGEPLLHVEEPHSQADGRVTTLLTSKVPLRGRDGAVIGVLGVYQDISERKRVEAERDALLARLQLHIERMPLAYVLLDADLRIADWNPAAVSIFGHPRTDALGMRPGDLVPAAFRPQAEDLLRRIRGGDMAAHSVNENVTRDGRAITCEWINTPLVEDDGRFAGVLCLAQDITERKSLEEQFRQAQKMEAFGQLAGGVAHDFNNLLTIISGYSDILLESPRLDDRSRELVREIHTAGSRAALLTGQLLAFSRRQVVQPRVLDLNAVVAGAEQMLGRLIGEDVTLTTAPAPGLDRVKADAGQVEQVLLNLVVNARDAMPRGGRITIVTANVVLNDADRLGRAEVTPGRYVRLTVTDTGCGMTEEVRRHIFEPFFTTKGPGKGTGLGLATVFGIVKQSGGHIGVASEVGRGTTFEIHLPAVAEVAPPPPPPVRPVPIPSGTETILIVEDEQGVRALTRAALQSNGYTLLEAADGEEAVRFGERHPGPIHLLVSDVVMPRMGGRQLAERLAALRPEMRVMFVSGYTDDAVVRHGVRQEEVAFLQKPFSPDALRRKVRAVLDAAG
jgi:two-component system cell cycle sensor histidine kinase/response regulator CckA